MLKNLAAFVVRRRRYVAAAWAVGIGIASLFAMRVESVVKGGSDGVPGSDSVLAVDRAVASGMAPGAFYQFLGVLHSDAVTTREPQFAAAAEAITRALTERGNVSSVRSFWTTGAEDLLGKSGKTALLLVRPNVNSFAEAELATQALREAVAGVGLPAGFTFRITGQAAVLYDLNKQSSSDLLRAERIGLPVTLVILLFVFGAPLAALLPLALALSAMTVSLAGLYLLSRWMVVSVFAENTVSMIGLGVGVDYALFLLTGFRRAIAAGATPHEAAAKSVEEAGHTVFFSGAAVAIGFSALFLVKLPFLKAMAIGGVTVVATAVLATLTLLPALMAMLGGRVNWPRKASAATAADSKIWARWAETVMRRPVMFLIISLAVLSVFVVPVLRLRSWNMGAGSLVGDLESRLGFETLAADFVPGWMGPAALVLEVAEGKSVLADPVRDGISSLAERLKKDPRVSAVRGYPDLDAAMRRFNVHVSGGVDSLPVPFQAPAADVVSPKGALAVVGIILRGPPESDEALSLARDLRQDKFPELSGLGVTARVTGAPALIADFDHEIFSKMWTVVPAVLLVTFLVLMFHFRSVLIPLKAIAMNLASVLASYGFLVCLFQDGHGASVIGLTPPGGLNAFIVLVLFTILFGLSMDYEVFLLARVKQEYDATGDNRQAVSVGLAKTAGTISSAAAIMVSIFVSFGFTRLVATREFGLGLAFAVALDATLIRLVLVPSLMALMGKANWWFPGRRAGTAAVMLLSVGLLAGCSTTSKTATVTPAPTRTIAPSTTNTPQPTTTSSPTSTRTLSASGSLTATRTSSVTATWTPTPTGTCATPCCAIFWNCSGCGCNPCPACPACTPFSGCFFCGMVVSVEAWGLGASSGRHARWYDPASQLARISTPCTTGSCGVLFDSYVPTCQPGMWTIEIWDNSGTSPLTSCVFFVCPYITMTATPTVSPTPTATVLPATLT